jgi:hypothetical protein
MSFGEAQPRSYARQTYFLLPRLPRRRRSIPPPPLARPIRTAFRVA